METQYSALPIQPLPASTDLIHIVDRPQKTVTLQSPASTVMTDLRIVDPISIDEDDTLDNAHARMISHGIRLLFVTDSAGRLSGLLTATDVLGERPVQCHHDSGKRRAEILVGDVMTPRRQLEVLQLADVQGAKVGNMVATLKNMGRQHALVVEYNDKSGHHELCGLFSTSDMARRLGISLRFIRVPKIFSEIHHTLLHGS